MWHKAEWMGRPMRLELTRVGLLVKLAYRYTTKGVPSLIQIICTQLYDFKYSYLIQIICTKLYGIKYCYLIQIICTQLYDSKYSYKYLNYNHMFSGFSRLAPYNIPTAPLQRSNPTYNECPAGALRNAQYSLIAIAHRSSLTQRGRSW